MFTALRRVAAAVVPAFGLAAAAAIPASTATSTTKETAACYNFDGRTVTVGGAARSRGQLALTRPADGYCYFAVTAGQFAWAGLHTW